MKASVVIWVLLLFAAVASMFIFGMGSVFLVIHLAFEEACSSSASNLGIGVCLNLQVRACCLCDCGRIAWVTVSVLIAWVTVGVLQCWHVTVTPCHLTSPDMSCVLQPLGVGIDRSTIRYRQAD